MSLLDRAIEAWPVVALGLLAAGACIGWAAHAVRTRYRIQTRPVLAVDGTVRGWRVFLGRLSLSPLRATRDDAQRHADAIEETL